MPPREVDAEHPGVEALAAADLESLDPVLVVADEDEGRAPVLRHSVEDEAHVEHRMAPQHRVQRPEERVPLATPEPAALPLARDDERGIEPEARVVDEDAPVHLAHVDLDRKSTRL